MAVVVDHSPASLMAGAALGAGDEALRSQRLLDMLRLRGQNLAERHFDQRLAEHDYRVQQDQLGRQDDQAARVAMAGLLVRPDPRAAFGYSPAIMGAAEQARGVLNLAALPPQQQLAAARFQEGQASAVDERRRLREAMQDAAMMAEDGLRSGYLTEADRPALAFALRSDPGKAVAMIEERRREWQQRQTWQRDAELFGPVARSIVARSAATEADAEDLRLRIARGRMTLEEGIASLRRTAEERARNARPDLSGAADALERGDEVGFASELLRNRQTPPATLLERIFGGSVESSPAMQILKLDLEDAERELKSRERQFEALNNRRERADFAPNLEEARAEVRRVTNAIRRLYMEALRDDGETEPMGAAPAAPASPAAPVARTEAERGPGGLGPWGGRGVMLSGAAAAAAAAEERGGAAVDLGKIERNARAQAALELGSRADPAKVEERTDLLVKRTLVREALRVLGPEASNDEVKAWVAQQMQGGTR